MAGLEETLGTREDKQGSRFSKDSKSTTNRLVAVREAAAVVEALPFVAADEVRLAAGVVLLPVRTEPARVCRDREEGVVAALLLFLAAGLLAAVPRAAAVDPNLTAVLGTALLPGWAAAEADRAAAGLAAAGLAAGSDSSPAWWCFCAVSK